MRSKLEEKVAKQLVERGVEYEYEPKDKRVSYTVPAKDRTYLPDFIIKNKSGKEIYIEPKGIWDLDDRTKQLLIRQQHGSEFDIRFVFQRAKSRIRKGSKTTYADICEGNGRAPFKGICWKYGDNGVIPDEWYEE